MSMHLAVVLLFGGHEVPCEPGKAPVSLDIGAGTSPFLVLLGEMEVGLCPLVDVRGCKFNHSNRLNHIITVAFQTKPRWPPGHRELVFLRTFKKKSHATTGA